MAAALAVYYYFSYITGAVIEENECSRNSKPLTSEKCKQEECFAVTLTNIKQQYPVKEPPRKKDDSTKKYKWKTGKWSQVKH